MFIPDPIAARTCKLYLLGIFLSITGIFFIVDDRLLSFHLCMSKFFLYGIK
jgi:hypothetical protein